MDYRSLLVHLDDRDAACLDVAAMLAKRFGATLQGAYLVPTSELTPFASAMLPDAIVEARLRETGDAQARAEARLREAAIRHTLTGATFAAPAGAAVDAAIQHARYADMSVVAQPSADAPDASFASELAHAVLMQSGRPVLVVPRAGTFASVGERVLVAWKESRESARAVADALPFLRKASKVRVVTVGAGGEEDVREALADKGIAAWLALQGVECDVRREVAEDVDAGNLILSRAADFGADLVVMGAYSRPRLSEVVLGGVTRLMLETMTAPVLMSH